MAYKITLTDRFLDSDFVPDVCLFSGRTDEVKTKKMNFTYVPPSAQAGFLIGGVLLMSIMSKRFSMEIPAAPKERFKWSLKKNLWILPLFLMPAVFCFAVLPFCQGSNIDPAMMAAVIGLVLGLIATIVGGIWSWVTQVSIKATDEGEISVRIPERLKSVYETYMRASQDYTEERRKRRRARGKSDDDEVAEEQEEDWANNSGAKWDEGEKK